MNQKNQTNLNNDYMLRMREMGYLKVPRYLLHLHFNAKGDRKAMADLYLYLMTKAYFSEAELTIGENSYVVERGEYCDQKHTVRETLGLKRSVFDRLLRLLEQAHLVQTTRRGRYTFFRIVDYDKLCGSPRKSARQPQQSSSFTPLEIALGGPYISMYGTENRNLEQEGGEL